MRILGIDYGDRHIGLAVSDPLGLTAQPLGTYDIRADDRENRRFFRDLAVKWDIKRIVLGYPLRMDGSAGTRAAKTETFAAWLRKTLELPVDLWDERLTTREALHLLAGRKLKGKTKKDVEDQVSAVIILAAYLESRRSENHDSQDS